MMARYGDKIEISSAAIRDLAAALSQIQQRILGVADSMDSHGLSTIASTNLISGLDGFEQISKLGAAMEHAFVYGLGTRSIESASNKSDYALGTGEALRVAEVAATFATGSPIVGPSNRDRSKKTKKDKKS